jgi:hypothetical protein
VPSTGLEAESEFAGTLSRLLATDELVEDASDMTDEHVISAWTAVATVIAPLIAVMSLIIYAVVYKAQLRQLKWSANQELMRAVMELDKLIVAYPQYYWVIWPPNEASSAPAEAQNDPRLKAIIYFHFNMFDMAFGYYTRILTLDRWLSIWGNVHERDDWEGWKSYIGSFMAQDYVAELFQAESARWFSPKFIEFINAQSAEHLKMMSVGVKA